MNKNEITLVRASWAKIEPNAEAFAVQFYQQLFILDPALQSLFKRSMNMQGRKLVSMFSSAIIYIDWPEKIIPPLITAGQRHQQYGVKPEDYDTVGEALITTLQKSLADEFTKEVEYSWLHAYNTIQAIMKTANALPLH